MGTEHFVQVIADTMDRIVDELGVSIVLMVTQWMDVKISDRVLKRMKQARHVTMMTNKTYTHNEIAGILSEMEMHVGMRTHSLILATSTCTPTVAIVYRPKNRGFMRAIEQENRMIEMGKDFNQASLFNLIKKTWDERETIREQMKPIIQREKQKARSGADHVAQYIEKC